jgi:hypothetical protein
MLRQWRDDVQAECIVINELHPVAPEILAHWREAVETEDDLIDDLIYEHGEIDRQIKWAELKDAAARRKCIGRDIRYFGGWLQEPKKTSRERRPADPEVAFRDKRLAAHMLLLELESTKIESVVETLKTLYGVKRSTIFSARKRWCPQLHKFGYDQMPPERRRSEIERLVRTQAESK